MNGSWGRWELVHVEREPQGLVVDALEVPDDDPHWPAQPITVCFLPTTDGERDSSDVVGARLEEWIRRDHGMCDVFQQGPEPYGFLALFQGSESLVLATVDGI